VIFAVTNKYEVICLTAVTGLKSHEFSKQKQLPHYYSFFIINYGAYRFSITSGTRKTAP